MKSIANSLLLRTAAAVCGCLVGYAAIGCTRSVDAAGSNHPRTHKAVTVNSLGITPLRVKTSNGAMALAPDDWSMTADDHGTVEMKSPDGESSAAWGVVGINRQLETYYGKMYGAPEDSIQTILSQALSSTGDAGGVTYTTAAKQVGYFTTRDWQTSTKSGTLFYHIYGDPNGQYEESFYVCDTDQGSWKKLRPMLTNIALSIRGHVELHAVPGGEYHSTPADGSNDDKGSDDENPLKDYNRWLGTQWFHDDAGNNFNVDPDLATVDGPDGEGVYKINGTDITKLHPGFSY